MFRTLPALTLSLPVFGQDYFNGRVIQVRDGDTARVQSMTGAQEDIRFHGIDSPKLAQPFGVEAGNFVRTMILNKLVTVRIKERDRYGRIVGEIEALDG